MDSNLKKLLAQLKRSGFDAYIESTEFQNLLLEIDADEHWNEIFDSNGGNDPKTILLKGKEVYQLSIKELLNDFYNYRYDEFHEFIIPLLKDFGNWTCEKIDIQNIKTVLKELGVAQVNLNKLNNINPAVKEVEVSVIQNNVSFTPKRIFIVHGSDKLSRLELKEMLKEDFHLDPVILMEQPQDTLGTIFTKLDKHARTCAVAIVLLTPDDIIKGKGQPRPNVMIELGYFLGLYPPENRKIILLRNEECEIASDIHGVERLDFKESIREKQSNIQKQLKHWNII